MRVLEAAYPEWLTAPEIAAVAAQLDPRAMQGWDRRRPDGRDRFIVPRTVLSRLHTQRVVDRIGTRVHEAAQVKHQGVPAKGQHPRVKWQRGAGHRYRLRKDAEDLL